MPEVKSMLGLALAAALLGGSGIFCTFWTFRFLGQGLYASTAVAAGFALFAFGLLAVRVIVAMGRVGPRVEDSDGATLVRPDPKVDRLALVSVLAAFASMLLYAVFGTLGMVDLPGIPRNDNWFVLMSAAGVVVGVPSLWRIATQGGMSYLRLSDVGFDVGDAYSRAEYTWDDLSDVSDRSAARKWAHTAGSSYLTTSDGRIRILASDWYTPDGFGLRRLLRFYWQHPEFRDELTDDRAAQRLRDQWWGPT